MVMWQMCMAGGEGTFGPMASDNKSLFPALSDSRPDLPYFHRHLWLSTILADKEWDVAICRKGTEVLGIMPYHIKQKLGHTIISMPPLTPYLGPWLFYPEGQKIPARLGFEKEVMDDLIAQLPVTDRSVFYTHPALGNVLPFVWAGHEARSRFTYVIPDISAPEKVFEGMQGNIRREIAKASATLTVRPSAGPEALHLLKMANARERQMGLNYSAAFFKKVAEAVNAVGDGIWLETHDASGQPVAALCVVCDIHHAHYLVGAVHPSHRTSGALSLLLWEAIKRASGHSRAFNFEGGMLAPIERFFRGFGAEPQVYHELRRETSLILRAANTVRGR